MNHKPSISQEPYESDYILYFDSVLNRHGSVNFIDRIQGTEQTIGINIDDQVFEYRVQAEFPPIIADLIDLAVAIYASDRLSPHNLRQQQRRLHVVLPVRNPELMSAEPFQAKLEDLLEWTTGSQWIFDFQRRSAPERLVEHPSLPIAPQGCEVALWSGGLDALAGLYTRLRMYSDTSFVLFGTGSNNVVYADQRRVANKVQSIFPNRCHLFRVPIRFQNSSMQRKNKLCRSRGVVFTLLGVACTHLMGQQILNVYENGIGAINLPYRASAVGLDHSRSAHPLTLLMVSDVVSELLGKKFRVQNPFLFWTKAKMCRAIAEDGRSDLPQCSKSCDSPHRQSEQPIQCGYCSSCLLRKQALIASKVEDRTRYVVPHGRKSATDRSLHLRHMLAQVDTLRNLLGVSNSPNIQWEALTRTFPELDDIVDRSAEADNVVPVDMQHHLIELYQTYVTEWDTVKARISAEFWSEDSKQQIEARLSGCW